MRDANDMRLTLVWLPGQFAVCRLDADAPLTEWMTGDFVSITRTVEELSVVCRQEHIPEGVRAERDWRCLRVAGTLDFGMIGVIAMLTKALADAGISVFVTSTFDTDYLMVRNGDAERAEEALREVAVI